MSRILDQNAAEKEANHWTRIQTSKDSMCLVSDQIASDHPTGVDESSHSSTLARRTPIGQNAVRGGKGATLCQMQRVRHGDGKTGVLQHKRLG